MALSVPELMEVSNETLMLWASMLGEESRRRKLILDSLEVHPGSVGPGGKPLPVLIRVMKKLTMSPPALVAKVEALIDGSRTP